MANRPVLDDLELPLAQKIDSAHDQVLARTDVPGLEGDFYASQGRRATQFTLSGVVTGAEAGEGLDKLREKFSRATPVAFVSDISTATRVEKVLIEELGVREIAGRPERFEYAFTLREFLPAPEPEIIIPPPPPPPPPGPTTSLEVRVEVLGEPDFDFNRITVTVIGTKLTGEPLPLTTLTKAPEGNVWPKDPMDPGRYTFTATAPEDDMTGQTEAEVVAGVRPNIVTIVLQRGGTLVGVTFVVHYRFDKSLVEPCMREVLKEVHERVTSGPSNEKLLIVGHTDKTGSNEYNQSLSERRARGAFAYLTFRRDPAAAVEEWNHLRRPQAGPVKTINDNWGTRQYQYMLHDLGFYSGKIDGDHGDITTAAVRRFQREHGLPETGFVNDATWPVLIEAYMRQSNFDIPDAKFLKNANPAGGCDSGILKWLGCGEEDPVVNTPNAFRPNRRTELIFVRVQALPCKVTEPDTFNLPAPGAVAADWCLDDPERGERACFLRRAGGEHQEPERILVQPQHQPGAAVVLILSFEDGSPAVNVPYVLIAPDGEFMDGEIGPPGNPRRGEPIPGFVGSVGTHAYIKAGGAIGVWTLEVQASVVARLRGSPPGSGKGPVVCKRITGDGDFDVILSARPQAFEFVDATNVEQTIDQVVFGQPFRLRADIPGETRDEVEVELMSYLIRR